MADEQSVPEEQAPEEKPIDPLSLFPPNIQRAVEGLAYLGQLTETVQFCGHSFGLRTLKPQHRFAIGQVMQPYRNTLTEVDAWQAAHIGMALTHVDGDRNFCPSIGPDPSQEDLARARLNYVSNPTTGWYTPTIEFLWTRYQLLEATAARAMAELHSLLQRSQPITSSPWQDSLIDQGRSDDGMNTDIQPSTTSKSS